MDSLLIPIEQFQNFLICLARVMAIFSALPVFQGKQIPPQVKVGIGFTTALLLFPLMAPYTPPLTLTVFEFALIIVNEVLIGMLLGLAARLVFTSISFAYTVIGYQMGFAAANIFDPQTTQQLSLMSQFANVIAILIFLSLDIHHLFFHIMVDSYRIFPPGMINFSGDAVPLVLEMTAQMFVLAVQISAPVLALLLISNMVLGLLSRVFPQLNVFMLSFPINIGLALLIIGLTLHIMPIIISREFDTVIENLIRIFQAF
jgi:flagellar biosynthetic protein FliR